MRDRQRETLRGDKGVRAGNREGGADGRVYDVDGVSRKIRKP